VHLYGQPTDMRKSYDGLQALARHAMGRDPLDGALYVFINRRDSQIKCLYFDRSGFCIWGKRLESGRFIGDWRAVRTHTRAEFQANLHSRSARSKIAQIDESGRFARQLRRLGDQQLLRISP
jgi:transposase